SSEGAFIEQKISECGAGIVALASDGKEVQHRSFPSSFQGDYSSGGYEHVLDIGLVEGAQQCAEEAVALLSAKSCPNGRKTIILDSSLLTLQVHESIGHALELDRVLGDEASYAGTSFATPEKLGNFQYGSEKVNITADPTLPNGLSTYGYDDEGVPARRMDLIKDGILVSYLTSRESAAQLDVEVTSSMRADGWARTPLIRMTNVNLEPGDSSLEKMISETDDGIFMKTVKVYSIDDKRLNFEFGPEISWEIKNGKLGSILKNARYRAMTPDFWNACDAVAGPDEWHLWGVPVCGKGEPGQIVHVGHGTAPARFRDIEVEGAA
ncbi:MAG: TldD/PmbA family protein, partial [Anaerolineaceae bacterium]|nr:TldD/PmbA family protein [Anaerolineaceae bacterium]